MDKNADLHYLIDVVKRRKFYFIIPCILVFLVFVIIAFLLPPVYQATATISIEAQAIAEDLVRTTAAGYVEERLQNISQRVLSDTNLLNVVERFSLYTDLKDDNTTQTFISKMRKNVQIKPVTIEAQSERLGRTVPITTAFTLSFEGKEPEKLAEVTNYLASLFLEENAREREKKTRTTIEFLEKQLSGLRSEISNTEAQLAAFKEKHYNELPELVQLNLRTMDQIERQIDAQKRYISDLMNRKVLLEGQLALLEPNIHKVSVDGKRIMTPKDELSVMRSEYLSLTSSLSPQHPDVIKLKKKLEALESEVITKDELGQLQRELYDKEHQLALLKEKVSPEHPDAIKLNKEVMLLRAQVQKLAKKQTVLKVQDVKPDNPAYIDMQNRIASTQLEIEKAQREIKDLQGEHEAYRIRVENTPRVEQEYLGLQRNYDNAKKNYEETASRLRAAREARGLEEGDMAEKFTMLQPASTPEKPYKPNRLVIVMLGLVVGLGSGIGAGSISEHADQSVYRAEELAQVTGHKVLTVIPYWETSEDISRKRRRIWVVVGGSVAIAVVGVVVLLNLLQKP